MHIMQLILLIFGVSGFTITGPTSPTTITTAATISTFAWSISSGTYTCTLSSYNGEFKFSTFSTAILTDTYQTGTFYQKVKFVGTSNTVLNTILASGITTYRARTYYIQTADTFTPVCTDYLELVCNDGTTTQVSTTIIGIGGG